MVIDDCRKGDKVQRVIEYRVNRFNALFFLLQNISIEIASCPSFKFQIESSSLSLCLISAALPSRVFRQSSRLIDHNTAIGHSQTLSVLCHYMYHLYKVNDVFRVYFSIYCHSSMVMGSRLIHNYYTPTSKYGHCMVDKRAMALYLLKILTASLAPFYRFD
jgi:hypothetical protein